MLGTLVKAIRILELFTVDSPQWGITEIGKELKLNKSSVFRVLQTLESQGYVRQDAVDSRYALTAKFLWLGSVVASQLDILKQSKQEIDTLWQRSGGTVVVRVIEGADLVTVAVRESSQALRISHPIGSRVNFNYGAIGKAILAHMSEQEVHTLIEKNHLNKFTSKTIVSPRSFLQELEEVRRNGFSFSDEEALQGVRAVGAPIFDMSGRPFAGISVGWPAFLFPKSKTGEVGKLVKQAATRISINLGYKVPLDPSVRVRKKPSPAKGFKVAM
jgi:DNA-binding IclR family transcriptional regulator